VGRGTFELGKGLKIGLELADAFAEGAIEEVFDLIIRPRVGSIWNLPSRQLLGNIHPLVAVYLVGAEYDEGFVWGEVGLG
jgi:hypothetical protein